MSGASRSAAVKRLMKELSDLQADPSPEFTAAPLEDNLFEWHFTIRGPPEAGFEGGRYHGRLIFPPDYPFKPPNISFLTPNGRFEVGKKICLSITGHHPEYWRPAWGVRLALVALISFLPTKGDGAIGALDYTVEERRVLAGRSRGWRCGVCGVCCGDVLPDEAVAPSERVRGEAEIRFSTAESTSAGLEKGSDESGEGQGRAGQNMGPGAADAATGDAKPSQATAESTPDANIPVSPIAAPPTSIAAHQPLPQSTQPIDSKPSTSQLRPQPATPVAKIPPSPSAVPPPASSSSSSSTTAPPSQPPAPHAVTISPTPLPHLDPTPTPTPTPVPQPAPPQHLTEILRTIDRALALVFLLLAYFVIRRVSKLVEGEAKGGAGRFWAE